MKKNKVLFICIHNSARSQMAEAFLNYYGEDSFEAQSAGFHPASLNPLVVAVMSEIGLDISNNQTKSVFDIYKKGALFTYVITVCDKAKEESCPIFPGIAERIAWTFDDPSGFSGTDKEKMEQVREVRDEIKTAVISFINQKI